MAQIGERLGEKLTFGQLKTQTGFVESTQYIC